MLKKMLLTAILFIFVLILFGCNTIDGITKDLELANDKVMKICNGE
jgi:predicted small secreted protein